MAKPDTVVRLCDADKEWIHNELGNIQVSCPEILIDEDYSEILLELLICMRNLVGELQDVISEDDLDTVHNMYTEILEMLEFDEDIEL